MDRNLISINYLELELIFCLKILKLNSLHYGYWKPGDEVVVTQLEHDANFTPWVLAARDAGATLRCVRVRPEDCTLDLDDLRGKISDRTRLVAVCCASNAVGTMIPITRIVEIVHGAGAHVFLDAVHYAPHAQI